MTRPEWRTTGLWLWRDRRESAYSVEKLGFGAWAKNLLRHGEIRSRSAEGLPAERARLT
jgi:hypothetical protein